MKEIKILKILLAIAIVWGVQSFYSISTLANHHSEDRKLLETLFMTGNYISLQVMAEKGLVWKTKCYGYRSSRNEVEEYDVVTIRIELPHSTKSRGRADDRGPLLENLRPLNKNTLKKQNTLKKPTVFIQNGWITDSIGVPQTPNWKKASNSFPFASEDSDLRSYQYNSQEYIISKSNRFKDVDMAIDYLEELLCYFYK